MLTEISHTRAYLTTPQAADKSGLSIVYLSQLARQGKLEGFRVGRDWCIYTDSLETFLAKPRKPGPKGPRKKPNQNSSKKSETTERDK